MLRCGAFHQFLKLVSSPIRNGDFGILIQIQIQFKSIYCISCKVFTISNSTINQILSIRTYYTTNTQIVNKVTNYIILGVFI